MAKQITAHKCAIFASNHAVALFKKKCKLTKMDNLNRTCKPFSAISHAKAIF